MWDAKRALETALFYNNPAQVVTRNLRRLAGPSAKPRQDGLVWSASDPNMLEWGPLDDCVMGGSSQSTFAVEEGVGVFAGNIILQNGGFAGARSRSIQPALDFSRYTGLRLRVKGDGYRYKFIIRDDYDWNGVAWAFSFDTKPGEWLDVEAPFTAFVPTKFARRVRNITFKKGQLSAVQITLSKFEYDGELNPAFGAGAFRLEVDKIEGYL